MKANELRIGNWVLHPPKSRDKRFEITVNANNILACDNGAIYKPIPLTEEWLMKFGFEKVVYNSGKEGCGTDYYFECNNGIFMCYADDFSLGLYSSEYDMLNGLAVIPNWEMTKHVHQLQNLFFALTGEELTIKQ